MEPVAQHDSQEWVYKQINYQAYNLSDKPPTTSTSTNTLLRNVWEAGQVCYSIGAVVQEYPNMSLNICFVYFSH